jgi:hypothetical protein
MLKNNKQEVDWAHSDAKHILVECLKNGEIPLDSEEMAPSVVYLQRAEFAEFPYEQFRDRLRHLRKKITSCKNRTSFDVAALKHDRKTHPKKATNHRDEPRWEGSKAEQYLKHDVENGKQDTMKPEALYNSRIEYKDYPLVVFRKHIYQEEKRRKFEAYCEVQAEKKKKKKKENNKKSKK